MSACSEGVFGGEKKLVAFISLMPLTLYYRYGTMCVCVVRLRLVFVLYRIF